MLPVFTIDDIRRLRPCYDPSRYLAEDWTGTALDVLDVTDCPAADRIWVALGMMSENDRRLAACRFVRHTPISDGRTVWDILTDDRSKKAVEVAERFAVCEATERELADAWDAAWDVASAAAGAAARDAADAAWAAARAAAGAAAGDAAWDVARLATRVGAWAADAARAAAWAAIRDAARAADAAWAAAAAARAAAAGAGARDAAAAWAAARDAQIDILREMLTA